MEVTCSHCGNKVEKRDTDVRRSLKLGMLLFCGRVCFGLSKRVNKSDDEKKKLKAEYDRNYRATSPTLKQRKSDWLKKDYAANPDKYKQIRIDKYPKHLKYLNRQEYKAWKQQYDLHYRAAKLYGEFSEAALLLKELESILDSQKIKYDTGITFNKSSQQRKRKWNSLQVKI